MYSRLLVLILTAALSFACYAEGNQVFYDTKNHPIALSNLKGKWLVVNYWADWCPTCIKEIPELNSFYQHTRDKNVLVYGINFDRLPKPDLTRAVNQKGIIFPVLVEDEQHVWNMSGVDVLPTTVIINPKGEVVKLISGATTEQDLLSIISSSDKIG